MSKNKSFGEAHRIPPGPRLISSRVTTDILPAAFVSTFFFVLSTLFVLAFMPVRTWSERLSGIAGHQVGRNLYLAELAVGKLLPSSPTKWLPPTHCAAIGNGIWSAEGTALITSLDGKEVAVGWRALYAPETSEFLYVEAGARHEGDFATACRRIKGE